MLKKKEIPRGNTQKAKAPLYVRDRIEDSTFFMFRHFKFALKNSSPEFWGAE